MSNTSLYDKSAVMYVLSALIKDSTLLTRTKYNLTEYDFLGAHKIVFSAVNNLLREGFQTLSPQQIDVYLKQYPNKYEVYDKEGGIDYLVNIEALLKYKFIDVEFDHYYETVKKYSILRDFEKAGIDTKQFYNPDVNIFQLDKEKEKFNKLEIKDLFNVVREKIASLEDNTIGKSLVREKKAAEGLEELLEEIKRGETIGYPLEGDIFNYIAKGARLGRLFLYSAPTGHGKALPNSVSIPTFYNGFKKVEEIKKGDFLIDRKGQATKVLETFPQGKKEVYEILFKDGRRALSSVDHLWTFHYGDIRYNKMQTKTLQEIINIVDKEGYQDRDGAYRIKVPMNKAVEYKEKDLKINPYLLGLFLGDGSFREQDKNKSLSFSTSDIELIEKITEITGWTHKKYTEKNYSNYFIQNGKLIKISEFLKDYPELINTYSYNKFIPKDYLYGSIEQRKSLVQGLLDSDGTVYNNKVRYTTTSELLREQFVELCYSLGYTVSVKTENKERVTYNIQIGAPLFERKSLFRLTRKINKFDLNKRSEKYEFNPIINIQKENYEEEMTCFLVDNEEHLFLMNDYIVTHNTRFLVGNACSLSLPYIENDEIIIKKDLQKVVFIATEMDPDEIQTLVLAWVSGVDEEKILTNTYNDYEENLIINAIKIIKEYSENFVIEKISDPSIGTLKAKLIRYIIQDSFYHIFYDYIFMTPALRAEFGNGQRDDVLLMMMANTLKELASDYGVFIYSATQVNRDWEKRHFRNENVIAGSKAVGDKVDFGVVAVKIPQEEREIIVEMLQAEGISQIPNIVIDIYKNRRGKITDAKLFRAFDYGTCRSKDLLLTDTNYNKIHGVGKIKYEFIKRTLIETDVYANE